MPSLADSSDHRWQLWNWDAWVLRGAQVVASGFVCYAFRPFALQALPAASAGILIALTVLLAEARVRHAETEEVIGGAAGTLLGLMAALLVTLVASRTSLPEAAKSSLELTALISLGYLGLTLGARGGKEFWKAPLLRSLEIAAPAPAAPSLMKLLDTSVLIDGRIADICANAFPGRFAGAAPLCPARAAISCRFQRLVETSARPPRPGSPAAHGRRCRASKFASWMTMFLEFPP